jgi:hypothetical protein
MFGIIPVSFRFRGKLRKLALIYNCFRENPGIGLHPMQVAKHTGMSLAEANNRLASTPEMFVRLPPRADGLTRYRLISIRATQTPEEVEQFLLRAARKETIMLYALGSMVVCMMLIVMVLVAPVL